MESGNTKKKIMADPGLQSIFQKMLRCNQDTRSGLKDLQKQFGPADDDVSKTLRELQDASAELQEQIDQVLDPTLEREIPTDGGAKAAEVFAIPELVEHIFAFLGVRDLLQVQQVNKHFRDVVDSSSKLQHLLFLQVRKDGHTRIPDLFHQTKQYTRAKGMTCSCELYPSHFTTSPSERLENEFSATITLRFDDQVTHLGSKIRDMFICLPPLKHVQFWAGCCFRGQHTEYNLSEISLDDANGIKMGQVFDKARELVEQHKFCIYAEPYAHDLDGNVTVLPYFVGEVRLQSNDPLVTSYLAARTKAKVPGMGGFALAKRTADKAGHPIPTFKEWKAAQGRPIN